MLVPGEFMLSPVSQEPGPQPQPPGPVPATPPALSNVEPRANAANEPEQDSFLLTLLRVLGVIHT
jgi:hypothetical protein